MSRPRRPLLVLLGSLALAGAALGVPAIGAAQETQTFSREVAATQDGWIETGLTLAEGDTAHLTAEGRATWDGGQSGSGPGGSTIESCRPVVPELPVGALLARVGTGRPVVADGASVKGTGPLTLAYNDCAGQYFDNAGGFAATIHITRALPASPAPTQAQSQPVADSATASTTTEAPAAGRSGGIPLLPLTAAAGAGLAAAAGVLLWRRRPARTPRFDPSAQLRSSAWLAPIHLRDLQGDRRPKRALTIGGPDADIDFGVQGVWAKLVPTVDGGARIEMAGSDQRVLVNDLPLILGQRLGRGYRVRIGAREFVYEEDRADLRRPSKDGNVLDKPDPRAA